MRNCSQSYKNLFAAEKECLNKHIVGKARVLDVCCGDGRSLKDILVKSKNLYGVDNDTAAVLDSRKCFSGMPEVSIVLADGRDLPYRDFFFDNVICMNTVENFGDDRHKFYAEMKRVLKDDGEIIISTYNEDAFEDRKRVYEGSGVLIKEINGTTFVFDEGIGANVSEQFSRKELEGIFYENGLRAKEIVKVGVGYICRLKKEVENEDF